MQKRTFIRTMLDIFLDNAIARTIASLVNFCKEQRYYGSRKLKFFKNMPISKVENQISNRYVFKAIRH